MRFKPLAILALLIGLASPGLMSGSASAASSQSTSVRATTAASETGPAQPAGIGNCPVGNWLCLWTRANFPGRPTTLSDPVPSGQCVALDIYFPGARSAVNRTNRYARFWSNSDCTGRNYLLQPGWSSVSDFGFQARGLGGR